MSHLHKTSFNGYYVDVLGNTYSSKRGYLHKMSYCKSNKGYFYVNISGTLKSVHRIVAETFLPDFTSELTVNHIDGNKLNNSVYNLEMVSAEENMRLAIELGLVNNKGARNGMSKLSEKQAIEIKYDTRLTHKELAHKYKVDSSAVSRIKSGKAWGHI